MRFARIRGLRAHIQRTRNSSVDFIRNCQGPELHCRSCFQRFAHRSALTAHLAFDSPRCAVGLIIAEPRCTVAEAQQLQQAEYERLRAQRAAGQGRWRTE
eukprot:6075705-Pyramimonas_sp.AAC.1